MVDSIYSQHGRNYICISSAKGNKCYTFSNDDKLQVKVGQEVKTGDVLYQGRVVNNVFYIDISRIFLLLLFMFICLVVWKGNKNIQREETKL